MNHKLKTELLRKSLHFSLLIIPFAYYYYGKWPVLQVILPICIIIAGLDYLRQKSSQINSFFTTIFRPILRDHELEPKTLSGSGWVALATAINFLVFKEVVALTSFLILVICDGLAGIVNRSVKSPPFYEKTIAGAAIFATCGLAILISCGLLYNMPIWFYLTGLFALFCVTMIECRPSLLEIDDNFTIPIIFSVVMSVFDLMWNYNY